MASMDDINKLADILRDKGDKILNNECKLALSTDLLDKLNDAFNLIVEHKDSMNTSFHVLANTNLSNTVYRDLLFLYDFVQKSKSLKLTFGMTRDETTDNVDLSKFKELRLLELRKINVNTITGLSKLRQRLQHLVCERSVNSLRDILERCGADESDGSVWFELKEAVFNHNGMQIIDGSLKFAPMLTSLDLTHNVIEIADGLSDLPNLKYLNMSFNKLTKIPSFTGQMLTRLQILVLSNNFIDDLQGLSKVLNLTQLDLADNCLIEHNSLIPLSYLAALQWLNLTGNPLYYHPQHRTRSVQYIHINTASFKFVLDQEILTTNEQRHIGTLYPKILQIESNETSPEISESMDRLTKVRPAIITENDDTENEDLGVSMQVEAVVSEPVSYREDLSSIHKDYITSLYNKTGLTVKELKTLESGSFPKSSTPLEDQIYESIAITRLDDETTYHTAQETIEPTEEPVEETIYDNVQEPDEQLSDDDFESGDSNIFLATVKAQKDDILVMFGSTHLVERDAVTAKILARFSLDSMYLCNLVYESNVQYVYFEFDTIKNINHRYYAIENVEERNRFFERLSAVVNSRPPKNDLFKIYLCLKCSTQFNVEVQNTIHKDSAKCPACSSNLVYEDAG